MIEWLREPLVPVMVNGKLPVAALKPTRQIRYAVPDPLTDFGIAVAMTFDGRPVTLKATLPENAGVPFTEIVKRPIDPRL